MRKHHGYILASPEALDMGGVTTLVGNNDAENVGSNDLWVLHAEARWLR